MKILIHSFAAVGIAAALACAGAIPAAAADAPATSAAKGGSSKEQLKVMLKGYDPVAYFKQGKAVRGNPAIRSHYNGVTYFFASKADKATFDQSPAKFEPQYGGFCANGVAHRKRSDSDPNVFFIYRDKLYVCSTPAEAKEFSRNLKGNVAKADRNWVKIGEGSYNVITGNWEQPWPFGPEAKY
jgi:YHS domain-containing protein